MANVNEIKMFSVEKEAAGQIMMVECRYLGIYDDATLVVHVICLNG